MFADADGKLRGVVTAQSLQDVLTHYQSSDWRADRALITGDLIQDDSPAAYQRFRNALEPLSLPMHCIPGNHDVRALMKPACSRPPFTYCASERIGNWLLVGLDSCVSGNAGGAVRDSELARAKSAIESSDAEHVLVFLHHPPVAMQSTWLDSVGLKNGAEFLTALEALDKVRAVLFGHVHQPYDAEHAGIRIIGTPSTCRQFQPQSDVFAVDSTPPAYRRLVLRPDGRLDTLLIWVYV